MLTISSKYNVSVASHSDRLIQLPSLMVFIVLMHFGGYLIYATNDLLSVSRSFVIVFKVLQSPVGASFRGG